MDKKMVSIVDLIISIMIVVIVLILMLFIIKNLNNTKVIKESEYISQKRKAELIISSIEYIYANVQLQNGGLLPTIEQMKEKYYIYNTKWIDNKIIDDSGFECEIYIKDNLLKIKCLDIENQKDLPMY